MRSLEALKVAGIPTIFTLSGNHVMSVFDAAVDSEIELIHVRHEGARFHGRRLGPHERQSRGRTGDRWTGTRQCGRRFVHRQMWGNAAGSALRTRPFGRAWAGRIQEMRQAEMAAPVTKASWTAQSMATLPPDIARAFRIAQWGVPDRCM